MTTEIEACHPGLMEYDNDKMSGIKYTSNSDNYNNDDVNNINIIQCNTKGGWK
jgi:hypothetical protein